MHQTKKLYLKPISSKNLMNMNQMILRKMQRRLRQVMLSNLLFILPLTLTGLRLRSTVRGI